MSQKYNAFISYKHSPLDSKVASDIQRNLERFRVPSDIKKSCKVDKISRVFRDKEELPLTSDLTATIESALKSSDHLIVICSKATKDSIWVQREIEYFLRTHSHDKILTVVTEGEPSDVVPEILQYKEVLTVDSNGDEITTKSPTEFLACDYRGELKKARKSELPRLVAALLGCSYDDLIKRQKQYRRKRLIATLSIIGALLVILATYFAWSTIRINQNYKQSLLNQSEYLAAESQKLYDDGDRLSAALLALEALPTDGNNRPLSQNALKALSKAIYAYRAPGINSPLMNRSFTHKDAVDRFELSGDERYLAVQHGSNRLSLWEVETGKEILNVPFSGDISDIEFSQDKLIALCESLVCYDIETAQKLWTLEEVWGLDVAVLEKKNLLVLNNGQGIGFIDLDTGKPAGGISANSSDNSIYFSKFQVSPDNSFVASTTTEKDIYIWDIEKSDFAVTSIKAEHISGLMFTKDNRLVVTSRSDIANDTMQSNLSVGESTIYYDNKTDVRCFDIKGNAKWETNLSYNQLDYKNNSSYHVITDKDGKEVPAVFVARGNICLVINAQNGKTLHKIETPDPIISIKPGDEKLEMMLNGGLYASYHFADSFFFTIKYYVGDTEFGFLGNNAFVVPKYSSKIYMYENHLYDTSWYSYFDNTELLSFTADYTQIGDRILFNELKDGDTLIYCFDIRSEKIIWKADVTGYVNTTGAASPVIATDDPDTVLITTSKGLYRIDMRSGESKSLLSEELSEFLKDVYYHNGYVYFMHKTYNEESSEFSKDLYRADINSGEAEIIVPNATESYSYFKAFPSQSMYLLWEASDDSFKLDIIMDTEKHQLEGITSPEMTALSEDGSRIVFVSGKELLIYSNRLSKITGIALDGRIPTGMLIHNDELYVAFESEELIRYDLSTGAETGSVELCYNYTTGDVTWDYSDEDRLIVIARKGLNVIDTETFTNIAAIDDCIGFDHSSNAAVVAASDPENSQKEALGRFRIYSTEALINKAKGMLGGTQLTDEQKARYGLSE